MKTIYLSSILLVVLLLTLFSNEQSFAESSTKIPVNKQVQIVADVTNAQDRIQSFAYIVQIQDQNNVTVSLGWLTGALSAHQSLSPALSWIPQTAGNYKATIFVWESIDNPSALSPPLTISLVVVEDQS